MPSQIPAQGDDLAGLLRKIGGLAGTPFIAADQLGLIEDVPAHRRFNVFARGIRLHVEGVHVQGEQLEEITVLAVIGRWARTTVPCVPEVVDAADSDVARAGRQPSRVRWDIEQDPVCERSMRCVWIVDDQCETARPVRRMYPLELRRSVFTVTGRAPRNGAVASERWTGQRESLIGHVRVPVETGDTGGGAGEMRLPGMYGAFVRRRLGRCSLTCGDDRSHKRG
jgi:hypothetical protein